MTEAEKQYQRGRGKRFPEDAKKAADKEAEAKKKAKPEKSK